MMWLDCLVDCQLFSYRMICSSFFFKETINYINFLQVNGTKHTFLPSTVLCTVVENIVLIKRFCAMAVMLEALVFCSLMRSRYFLGKVYDIYYILNIRVRKGQFRSTLHNLKNVWWFIFFLLILFQYMSAL